MELLIHKIHRQILCCFLLVAVVLRILIRATLAFEITTSSVLSLLSLSLSQFLSLSSLISHSLSLSLLSLLLSLLSILLSLLSILLSFFQFFYHYFDFCYHYFHFFYHYFHFHRRCYFLFHHVLQLEHMQIRYSLSRNLCGIKIKP